jgi:hypothetical protein
VSLWFCSHPDWTNRVPPEVATGLLQLKNEPAHSCVLNLNLPHPLPLALSAEASVTGDPSHCTERSPVHGLDAVTTVMEEGPAGLGQLPFSCDSHLPVSKRRIVLMP